MTYVILNKGNLIDLAELSKLDILSMVISSVCHDYGHDGFTNAYHINAMSERAIRYSDKSVQENFHCAESFAILSSDEFNFMAGFSRDDFVAFRKRFIGIILATDMAKHMNDIASIKALNESKGVEAGKNAEQLIDHESATKKFDSQ